MVFEGVDMDESKSAIALVVSTLVAGFVGFFTWSSKRWVDGIEKDISQLQKTAYNFNSRLVAVETGLKEIRNSLERIEEKLDKVISRAYGRN